MTRYAQKGKIIVIKCVFMRGETVRDINDIRSEITKTDSELLKLFDKRMELSHEVFEYKSANGLDIEDKNREQEVLSAADNKYQLLFLKNNIALSKACQRELMSNRRDDIIPVKTQNGGYNILFKKGAVNHLGDYIDTGKKALIVTESGVPSIYAETVKKQCENSIVFRFKKGEKSKNTKTLTKILKSLFENGFTREDCVIAVGGGVTGDMAGLAASLYMRGIDFYNIPTTLLAMADASIGGKTAVDFCGAKNILGAFYQPKAVIADINTLKTLPERQRLNGLLECVKMAATSDRELFELIESGNTEESLEKIIRGAINIKKKIIELDETENGPRRILNFGHTVGHAVEMNTKGLYHGECVALGMLYFSSPEVVKRLNAVYEMLGFKEKADIPPKKLLKTVFADKKRYKDGLYVVTVEKIGEGKIVKIPFEKLRGIIEGSERL